MGKDRVLVFTDVSDADVYENYAIKYIDTCGCIGSYNLRGVRVDAFDKQHIIYTDSGRNVFTTY